MEISIIKIIYKTKSKKAQHHIDALYQLIAVEEHVLVLLAQRLICEHAVLLVELLRGAARRGSRLRRPLGRGAEGAELLRGAVRLQAGGVGGLSEGASRKGRRLTLVC